MTKKTLLNNNASNSDGKPEYGVVLPCAQEEFGQFISSLLGKAQTIEKDFYGVFTLTPEDINDTFHLVDQRVSQQNEATLTQFTLKIIYDDNSSVSINSLQEFLHYKEIHPIVSTAVHLTWSYLVRFQDKKYPEKQQIEMSIVTGGAKFERNLIIPIRYYSFNENCVTIRISHTGRTWGIDIESLLSGHIKHWLKEESKVKQFVFKNSGKIGFACSIIFLLIIATGIYNSYRHFHDFQVTEATEIIKAATQLESLEESVSKKLNFLIESIYKRAWGQFMDILALSFIGSIIVAPFFGIWVSNCANNPPKSFVLLSKRAIEVRDNFLKRRKRGWIIFPISIITSIIAGVLANIIFNRIFLP